MPNPNGRIANLKHLPAGPAHPRWSDEKIVNGDGYVKLRVGREHPLADPNGYAYEHLVVWVSAGNPRPPRGWVLHHQNEVKSDNRLSNLELKRKGAHGVEHASPLTDRQVRGIRWRYAVGPLDTMKIADRYAIRPQLAWNVIKGKTRRDAGGPIQTGSLKSRRYRLDGVEHNARPEVRAHA
jgi:hypothetical protein